MVESIKSHCCRGHEWVVENVYINPQGSRVCRTCSREARRKWAKSNYARLRADPIRVEIDREDGRIFRKRHPEKVKKWGREQYWKLRNHVIQLYGRQCAFCGFADERALQLDHVNGGGAKQKNNIGTLRIYRQAVAAPFSGDYQLLCANCNWIKAYESYEKVRNAIIN